MQATCYIEMLGGLRVHQGERVITRFRTQKTGAVLAYLAHYLTRDHPREVLVDLLWPESDPEAARANLRAELSSLRRQLEPPGVPSGAVLRASRSAVQLNPQAVSTDVTRFEAALRAADRAHSETERLESLNEATSLYPGPLLPGLYQDWVFPERDRLADLFFRAAHSLCDALAATGDLSGALDCARRAVGMDPDREEAHRDVIRLLSMAGQPEAATRRYSELVRILRERLGEEPSAATRELMARLPAAPPGTEILPEPQPAVQSRAQPEALPFGAVTFLLTAIERSTPPTGRAGTGLRQAREVHHALLREAFRRHCGHEMKDLGDGFLVAFAHPSDALTCAIDSQRALARQPWPRALGTLPVRMALYTADVELKEGQYQGLGLRHAASVLTAAHGGQLLCAEGTAGLLRRDLEADVRILDLGTYRLRGTEVSERLFQVNYPGMPIETFPPLVAEQGYRAELPLTYDRFVGRDEELGRLCDLLLSDQGRIVSLTGPAGSGKSRLALEASRRLVEPLLGAVWFVPLQDVPEASLLPSALAGALGLPGAMLSAPLDQAAEILGRQRSLLILDTFEHLAEGGASVVLELVEKARSTTYLVTSRHCLNLRGELDFPVAPLPVPEVDETAEGLLECSSVRLFVDRAQAVRPDFQVTRGNAPAVAELCRRLDGIPLAIELAAARVQVLTPAQMLTQLQDRFAFLVNRRRDAVERHRTLHAALQWSHQLLSPGLQGFFARLCVFRGGWTAEAALVVCQESDVFEHLLDLRDHSLVSSMERGGSMRYQMLDSVREFGAGLLAREDWAAVAERHAEYFLAFALARAVKADSPDEALAYDELEADLGSVRAALDWAIAAGRDRMVAELAAAMSGFLWRRGLWQEQLQRVREGLAAAERLSPPDDVLTMRLLRSLARVACDCGDLVLADHACAQGMAAAEQADLAGWRAHFLNLQALLLRRRGDVEESRRALEQSLELFRQAGDGQGEGMALHNLGLVAYSLGDVAQTAALYGRALPLRRRAGDVRGTAETENNLAFLAEEAGDLRQAEVSYRQALQAFLTLGDVLWIAVAVCNLGEIALKSGNRSRAAELLAPAERALRHLGSVHGDHAAGCLQEALGRKKGPPVEQTVHWREGLLAAAQGALR